MPGDGERDAADAQRDRTVERAKAADADGGQHHERSRPQAIGHGIFGDGWRRRRHGVARAQRCNSDEAVAGIPGHTASAGDATRAIDRRQAMSWNGSRGDLTGKSFLAYN